MRQISRYFASALPGQDVKTPVTPVVCPRFVATSQWTAMKYVLVLLFACGRGCGSPAEVSLPSRYETLQLCLIAGNAWLSPKANPTRAVKDFRCKPAPR
jgi:hypothetical protein